MIMLTLALARVVIPWSQARMCHWDQPKVCLVCSALQAPDFAILISTLAMAIALIPAGDHSSVVHLPKVVIVLEAAYWSQLMDTTW